MQGQSVELNGVEVTFPNGFTAVRPTSLSIRAGEFFSILGPSGCGKTTILRTISGFIDPTAGVVLIGDENQRGLSPNMRPTALIFQNLALFPLMSVRDNVAFGLEARGMGRRARRDKTEQLLSMLALDDHADKKPAELSGGQRQRVAIARALAVEPAVLLLDEPLCALDLKLRTHLRSELRDIQQRTGVTFIYITHDQGEALTMSDRIAVMNAGRIEQVGTADDVYSNPSSAFVASFVGETNQFKGRVSELAGDDAYIDTSHGRFIGRNPADLRVGDQAFVFIRPEHLGQSGCENAMQARVQRRTLEGPFVNVLLLSETGAELVMHVPNTGADTNPTGAMQVSFSSKNTLILPEGPLARIGREALAAQ